MSQTTTTYVRYFHPGAFVSEESVHEIADRDPKAATAQAPASAFAFEFFDKVHVTTPDIDGTELTLSTPERHRSGRFYIDGQELSEAAVAAMGDGYSIMLENMRSNRWPAMVRCRAGNFQPLRDGDAIVSAA
jgi:hypothetical protein